VGCWARARNSTCLTTIAHSPEARSRFLTVAIAPSARRRRHSSPGIPWGGSSRQAVASSGQIRTISVRKRRKLSQIGRSASFEVLRAWCRLHKEPGLLRRRSQGGASRRHGGAAAAGRRCTRRTRRIELAAAELPKQAGGGPSQSGRRAEPKHSACQQHTRRKIL
jgi:hypothetical protein